MKLPSRVADIRLFSDEGRAILSEKKPLQGFSKSIQDSIKEATSGATNSVQKGHDYLIWMLTNVFEETIENAENAIIDGPDDCGIDAVLRYEKEITLIQSKFGESHDIGMIDKFVKDVERFKNAEQSSIKRDDLSYLWNEINQKGVKLNLVYVTEQYADYESDVVQVIDMAQTNHILLERKMKPEKGHKATIRYIDGYQRKNIFHCTVNGVEIANLVEKNRYILDNNIRHHLGHRMKVNKGIRKTLEECPEKFAEYNNGSTMTAVDVKVDEDKKLIHLDSPIIVNGAQSSHGILDVSKKRKSLDAETQLKIIKTDDEEHQKNITRFSNSQNAVKGKDLVALEDFWKSISFQMETRMGYFFEYQSGSWDYRLDAGDRAKFQGNEIFNQYLPENHKKKLASKDAIQTYVAYFKQNPSGAYQSISKFLPGGAEYEKIFTDELMDDYRIFLFPTLIMECAKNELEYGPKNKTHPYKRYSTIFFVGVTGKIIHEYILETKDDFDNDISELESLIKNVTLFKRILRLTDKIVDQVLASPNLTEELVKVNNSPHNLFSKSIYNYDMKKVIEHYISLESAEISDIKETFSSP
jgi:hypothetical protein